MRTIHRLATQLRSWLRPAQQDAEFGEELRFHLDQQIEANLASGMTEGEAVRAARLALGHLAGLREESRGSRPGAWFRQILRDAAYGGRLLRKAPAFAVTGILIVALGIGAVTAIFSVVYGVVLSPLPYAEPERLVNVWMRAPGLALPRVQVTVADQIDWQASNHVFGEIAILRTIANFNITGGGEPERLFAARVSASLFRVLGVTPALGRGFTDEENAVGRDRVAILSDGLWRRRFGSDRSIVGGTINLSGVPHTVVGVMKPDFQYPGRETQLWTPLTFDPEELVSRLGNNYVAVARLEPGVTLAEAQGEMDVIAKRLANTYPATAGIGIIKGVEVVPLLEQTVGAVRPTLYVLFGAVSCLLLIACLNLANLLGARAASRAREFAVRLALGASRTRLALQAVAEVAPIVLLGGALGVAAAMAGVAAFVPLAPATLPRTETIAVSLPVLLFSTGLLALTGLVGALLPGAQAWRSSLTAATREESRSSSAGPRQSRARNVLVVAQIALVLPLLVGAGLLTRTFSKLVQVDPGFRADNVLSLHLAIPRSKYQSNAAVAALCGRLVERIGALPGVASVAMVNRLPLAGVGQVNPFEFESPDPVKPTVASDSRTITPDYFRTMGIPLREGRLFTDRDGAAAAQVGIIDERIARSLWPGKSALGHRFRFPPGLIAGLPWVEVVGVVGHVRHDGLDVDPRPQIYFNYLQRAQDRMVLVVRGAREVQALTPAVIAAIKEVDPDQAVYDVRTMEDVVERSTSQRWLNMTLVTTFASMALLLASVGVYGVISFGVMRQAREFGIRLALGAERRAITRLVLRRGATLAASGAAIGLAAAVLLTRAMASLLYGVTPGDPVSFVAAPVLLVLVALVASYLPARRAASVDPAITLRGE